MTMLKAHSKVREAINKDLAKFNSETPERVKRKYNKKVNTGGVIVTSETPERVKRKYVKKIHPDNVSVTHVGAEKPAKRAYRKRSDVIETGRHVIVHLSKDGHTVKNVFIDEEHASQVLNLAKDELVRSLDSEKSTKDFMVTIALKGAFNQRKIERLARKKVKDTIMKKDVAKIINHVDFSTIDTRILRKISKLIETNK
jgi:hypothetical protein